MRRLLREMPPRVGRGRRRLEPAAQHRGPRVLQRRVLRAEGRGERAEGRGQRGEGRGQRGEGIEGRGEIHAHAHAHAHQCTPVLAISNGIMNTTVLGELICIAIVSGILWTDSR